MKKEISSIVKKFAAVVLAAAFLVGESAYASEVDVNGNVDEIRSQGGYYTHLERDKPVDVLAYGVKGVKDADAEMTMYTKVGYNDTVNAYLKNKDGTRVSSKGASFRALTRKETQSIPYISGMGVKGEKYFICLTLNISSQSSEVDVDYDMDLG